MPIPVRQGGGKKWTERASIAGEAYEQGIKNPRKDWAQSTLAAAENYSKGITEAIAKNRFSKGVSAAGTSKQQQGALQKGAGRFAQGVQVSQQAYEQGIEPYLTVIRNLTLPPRGPKGSPQNIQRVTTVTTALRNKKVGG